MRTTAKRKVTKGKTLSHSLVHYLLHIHKRTEGGQRCRATDVAGALGVARSTTTLTIRRLKQHKFIEEDENHNLFLLPAGHKSVHNVLSIRNLFSIFFEKVLGAQEEIASANACRIESLISEEIQEKLFQFLKEYDGFLSQSNLQTPNATSSRPEKGWLTDFTSLEDFRKKQAGDLIGHFSENFPSK